MSTVDTQTVGDNLSRDATWSTYAEADDLIETLPEPGVSVIQTRGVPEPATQPAKTSTTTTKATT